MRRQGILVLTALAMALAGCGGGDDGGGNEFADQEEEARQAVTDLIAAYQQENYETVCELQDERVNKSIAELGKEDTCAQGYEELFRRQKAFAGGDDENAFDDFVTSLQDYEVGEAALTEKDGVLTGQVLLEGELQAASLVVEEDGVIKVSELFVTPDANANPGSFGQ